MRNPNGHCKLRLHNKLLEEPIKVVIVNSFTSWLLDHQTNNYRQDEVVFEHVNPGETAPQRHDHKIPLWATGFGLGGGSQTYKLVVRGLNSGKTFINDVDDLSFYIGPWEPQDALLVVSPGHSHDELLLSVNLGSGSISTHVKQATLYRTDGEMIVRPNRQAYVYTHNGFGHQVSDVNLIFKCGEAWKQTLHVIRIEEGQTYSPETVWFRYREQPCFLRINLNTLTMPVENAGGWVPIHLLEKDNGTKINVDLNATTTITLADGSLYQMQMKPRS